jgi:hypothetical protein
MGLWLCSPSSPSSLNNYVSIKKLETYLDGDLRQGADIVVEKRESALAFTCHRLQDTWDFWPGRRLYSLLFSTSFFLLLSRSTDALRWLGNWAFSDGPGGGI